MEQTVEVVPLPLGLFTLQETPRVKYPDVVVKAPYVVCAYVVRHPAGTILFDTGIAGDVEAVARYAPRAFDLEAQLDSVGLQHSDIDVVVNCHLHCDHAGGNSQFPGVPIFVQRSEVAAAGADDYTVRAACIDFPGATLHVLDGPHPVLPGITVVPTPGHSPGHQSLLVRGSQHGSVLLAGQAFDTASEYALAALANQLGGDAVDVASPEWMADLCRSNIDVALFAHDLAQWRPAPGTFVGTAPVTPWPQP